MLLKKYRSHHFLILLKKDFNFMDITVSAKNIKGDVDAIASKSYAHRILIAAALSDKPCKMLLNSTSEDIEATEGCIARAGGSVEHDGLNLLVSPLKNIPKSAVFDCCESGSLIRFLIPVAAALGIDAVFTGRGRLPQRPQQPILEAVSRHGITVSKENEFPVKISGKLKSGEYTLPGNISSQYTTGLLFALPLLTGDSVINLIPPVESKPYIDMTISVLKKFGITVTEDGCRYFVKGGQKYISPEVIKVDGDWSNGAFFIAAGALSHITVNGLNINSVQGDKEIAEIVKHMGADVSVNNDSVTVKAGSLKGIEIDASNIPDLVPVISALSVFAEGQTVIKNAARLRLKESDRLKTVAELIKTAGGDVTELSDGLIIKGGKKIKSEFTVPSFNDHRLVMAASLLSFGSKVTITQAQAINKTYPSFWREITNLGGVCNVINDR